MADLTIRRGGGGLTQNDPFEMVRESMRRMQDLFRDPVFQADPLAILEATRAMRFVPDFEVRETKDGLVFQADLPGVNEDDVDITVVGNRLRINGKRDVNEESRGDTWYAAERSYGSFARTFVLPEGCDTDNVDANLENGVLTVKLGKRQGTQPRRIRLGGGRQRALEGQYQQGPFHQSAASGAQNVGAPNAGEGGGQQGQPQGGGKPGEQGYGGMYGTRETPEACGEYGAAAGGFEHGEQAGQAPRAGHSEPEKK